MRLREHAGRLSGDRKGNFGVMASALAVPLVMAAGAALDLSTINMRHSQLQQALDAAVLAVAREGKDISDAQGRQIAADFVATNYQMQVASMELVRNGSSVTIKASTRADMAFGALFGYDDWAINAEAGADIAYASYEIALVLDTTGSMAGGKLTALKDAVDGMIESMSAQIADKDKLKMALVPFATFVNVGPQYGPQFKSNGHIVAGTGAPWLDLKGKSDIAQLELQKNVSRFEVMHNLGQEWKGCVETRPETSSGEHDVQDTTPAANKPETLFVPAFAIDEPAAAGYSNDYILSLIDPMDQSLLGKTGKLLKYGVLNPALATTGLDAVLGPVLADTSSGKGPNKGCDMRPITPLTNNYTLLRSEVSQLNAAGTTNIMEGVAWGTRVLTPGEPFAQGKKASTGLEKIMIVLTDGSNVIGANSTPLKSSYSSFGFYVDGRLDAPDGSATSTNAAMNARTLAACDYAKKHGITVYTIRLEEPNVATGEMLKQCASGNDHFFDAPSRTQLDDVFKGIRERVVKLRLSS